VADLGELLRFWQSVDRLFARIEETWWGAVVSDPRFPRIHEANYARVDTREPIPLAEIERLLLPAARAAGSPIAHTVVFHPEEQTDLLAEAGTRGERMTWDLVMRRFGPPPEVDPRVTPIERLDEPFWAAFRATQRVFGVEEEDAIEEMVALEREVMIPAGRTWFAVRDGDGIVALASLLVRSEIGYVDGVSTLPEARRRGHATALTTRILAEAAGRKAAATYLLAEPDGDAERIYRRLGFETVSSIGSWVGRADQPTGSAAPRDSDAPSTNL
jgi:ribosomal protein S18 acetylase RimI-like enzyme